MPYTALTDSLGGGQARVQSVCGAGGRGGGSSPAGTPWAGAVWRLQDQGKSRLPFEVSPDQGRPTQDDLFLD